MDAAEKRLYDAVNKIVDKLKELPRGDPRHIRLAAQLNIANRKLNKYRHDHGK